ncbi:5'-methylthioadenosine/adenosylhomocysteine nucleosidase [Stenoxybacter acetivorans]|uniref:5'-methylthioadenosine/adenosylhomocysteine nucleosidase n=1 Tax=Stenoxybacter acetivorans TaxID=422441 RepID=UPI00055B10F3|nr:5'-methylthioadenosine/adenosylhomocysteine nucleosidase [Stenoxybacter acetivorans]
MSERAPIGIIAAMPPELNALIERLVDKQYIEIGAFVFYQGCLAGKLVVLALSGIGKVNAAITAALLIERFSPSAIINTGSAGGLGTGMRVGDVVIGAETAHHDVDVCAFGYNKGQIPQLPARFESATEWVDKAGKAAEKFTGATVHHGLIVSGDQFIHDARKVQAIKEDFIDVLAVEMEAAAIAQTCYQMETPFVVVRAVSDSADEKAEMSFDAFLETAGRRSADMVEALIQI